MTTREQEVYKVIRPLLEGYTEGLSWDFKQTLSDTANIIKDILAFSNSSCDKDSYIIVGVGESGSNRPRKLKLTTTDRQRLKTDASFLYLPARFDVHGISGADMEKMNKFSETLTQSLRGSMLISTPMLEFVPIEIKAKRWLYVIIVKPISGVFISSKDIPEGNNKTVVRQGVLYVRHADVNSGHGRSNSASAGDHIRVWKNYLDNLATRPKTEVKDENSYTVVGGQHNE